MSDQETGTAVLERWTVECDSRGTRITSIESTEDAKLFAEEDNRDRHEVHDG